MQIFRNMTEQDVIPVAELEKKVFSDAWTSTGIYETFCQDQAFVAVAECDGEITGYCIIYYVMDEGEIARIAVDEKVRRQGVGRGLLDFVCECCKIKNVYRLLLDVRESNESARRFYRQYGFTVDGVRKKFYDQPKENAVLMSKNIL
ncbi:MAG: ribosomal protein S18-alanine N-acetyltransferase [Faecalimonas sp.]|nr:ribosomal protein S18-alanine N-acetyltransferase [Faecalimonas sp.]